MVRGAARRRDRHDPRRDPRDFEPPVSPPAQPRPAGQTGVDERKLEPAEAAAALGRTAVWPGRSVDGVELAEIEYATHDDLDPTDG